MMTPAMQAYEPILMSVGAHLPASQREARCGMMLLRDRANLRLRSAEPEACEILASIERLGILHSLSTMTDEQANKLYCAMGWMMAIASDVQTVFKPDDVASRPETE